MQYGGVDRCSSDRGSNQVQLTARLLEDNDHVSFLVSGFDITVSRRDLTLRDIVYRSLSLVFRPR
jgi:hypothetical protein